MDGKPLPLEQLIGAPLRALVLGQGIATQATADFISEVGFHPASAAGREPAVRMLEFTYTHPVPDPTNPGAVANTPVRVSVPLLTLVSIPNVAVAEATITFGVNIVAMKAIEGKPSEVQVERRPSSEIGQTIQMFGVYAPMMDPKISGAPTVSFTVKVAREPLGEGLNRVLSLLQDGMTSQPMK